MSNNKDDPINRFSFSGISKPYEDIANSPFVRAIDKANRLASTIAGIGGVSKLDMVAAREQQMLAASKLLIPTTGQRDLTLGALIRPLLLPETQEWLLNAQQVADSMARTVGPIIENMQYVQAALATNSVVQSILRSAELFHASEAVKMASAAIPRIINAFSTNITSAAYWPTVEFAQAHRSSVLGLIELNALCGQPSLVEVPAILASELALETYRALDVDGIFSGEFEEDGDEVQGTRELVSRTVRDEIIERLTDLDPKLVPLLQGARLALKTFQEDAARQMCVSLRELLRLVMEIVSPDDEVRAWSTAPEHVQKGKPTRRGRMEFVLTPFNGSPIESFLKSDIQIASDLVQVLNHATHELYSQLTRKHLEVVLVRTEAIILVLLKVAGSTTH